MDPAPFFASLRFRWPWRPYQTMILDLFERRDPKKRTFHVVAPPGSGKTIVGLEIARRLGRPAVTFSPTTTIQEQWREKVLEFRPEEDTAQERANVLSWVSAEPGHLGAISCLTYQSLATQTEQHAFLDRVGRAAWLEELTKAGRSEEGSRLHIEDLHVKAPDVYARTVASRARSEKRRLLATGEAGLDALLHPNALDLIERIVAQGTGCVILDEVHHLLDYWAMILARLIARLPQVLVVGLTATPPASAAPEELGNYLALVDGIDFEVPTPAVVKSGSLAPYQDLVLITEPTPDERRFLSSQRDLLETAIRRAFSDRRFAGYVEGRVNRPKGGRTWTAFLDDEFDVAVAGVRYLVAGGRPLAKDVDAVPEMRGPPTEHDRLTLVRDWCLGFLRLSKEPTDQDTLADLRAALRTLGLVMTETGWRQAPGPIDRVLAYSASKTEALVRILGAEADALGDDLRAVVLTDFERESATALHRLRGVLDPASGGAVQAFRAVVRHADTNRLDPVMVTGHTVLADADLAERFMAEVVRWFRANGLEVELSKREEEPGLVVIEGSGGEWMPRNYVACITDLFEAGVTRCLVGTRGLLAEGWDALKLNALVDLTTAGTFASVNQIRGRSIRLDPEHPRKVADNWDVACLASDLPEGQRDLVRFMGKHQHSWGLGPGKRIVKGVAHVDPRVLFLTGDPAAAAVAGASVGNINRRSLARVGRRDHVYDEWGVGQPYQNFEFRSTVLSPREANLKTAFTWKRSLRALLNLAFANLAFYLLLFVLVVPRLTRGGVGETGLLIALAVLGATAASAPFFWRYAKAAFLDLPVDSYLADFGKAVAEALHETGVAPASAQEVRVVLTEEGTYDVHLDTKDARTADAFADAYGELFEPIVDQRYLVVREEASLSGSFYRPLYYLLRSIARVARRERRFYHPVPDVFGRKKELAEAFGEAWRRWVGGGAPVYTRTEEGTRILLHERARAQEWARARRVDEWR